METVMGIDDVLVREIVRRILTVTKPDKIILFSSTVAGGTTEARDIDLLIVEPEVRNRREEYITIRQAIGEVQYPVGILFVTSRGFRAGKDTVGGPVCLASKHGRVIYELA